MGGAWRTFILRIRNQPSGKATPYDLAWGIVEADVIHRSQPPWYGGRASGEARCLPEFVADEHLEPKRTLSLRPVSSNSSETNRSVLNPPPESQRRPKLLDRVREAPRLRHRSPKTEKAYVAWIRRFIIFNGKRHPSEMRAAEIERFSRASLSRAKSALRRRIRLSRRSFSSTAMCWGWNLHGWMASYAPGDPSACPLCSPVKKSQHCSMNSLAGSA
jgi:Phage integrase, N-terminal SAM-like domain